MMTHIKIELTDDQRRHLQRQLTGKSAPITRKELTTFVDGIVQGALACEAVVDSPPVPHFTPSPDLTQIPQKYMDRHGEQTPAFWAGWLRGWNQVASAVK